MSHLAALETVDDVVARLGLTLRKVLKEDYDNNVYLVDRDGTPRILKMLADPKLLPNFRREIAYTCLLASLAAADESWTLRVSAPVATGEGWMLREVVDGEPVLDVHGPYDDEAVHRLAAALADLDRLSPDPASRRPDYRNGAGEPVADENDRVAELRRWVEEAVDEGEVEGLTRDEIVDRLREGRAAVQPGLELWDTKLDEFIAVDHGKVALFDLEFAHLFGRRHYDLAKLYASLAVHGTGDRGSGRLLTAYVAASSLEQEDVLRAALPVLAETLLAQLYDAVTQPAEGAADRRRRSGNLLARALLGDVDALMRA